MTRDNEDADLEDFLVDLEEESDFFADEGDDLGLLGYFIGKSTIMEILHIERMPERGDEISRFLRV